MEQQQDTTPELPITEDRKSSSDRPAAIHNKKAYNTTARLYSGYYDDKIADFMEADAMPDTDLSKPRSPGQERRRKQRELLYDAWDFFFGQNYHPLSPRYANNLLVAFGNQAVLVFEYMAHFAPRQHLPDNPMRHPYASIMDALEREGGEIPAEPEEDIPF